MKTDARGFNHFEKHMVRIRAALDELNLIPVRDLARKWKTTPDYVRRNVPVVKLGPKKHRVRLEDAVAFQQRRTQQP